MLLPEKYKTSKKDYESYYERPNRLSPWQIHIALEITNYERIDMKIQTKLQAPF